MKQDNAVVAFVADFYAKSGDFKGCPLPIVLGKFPKMKWQLVVKRLIEGNRLQLLTEAMDVNPHIKRTDSGSVEVQLEALARVGSEEHGACLYPHPNELKGRVDLTAFEGRPYSLALALGAPQLEIRSFNLSVLETYRNDPRYTYQCDDMHGFISVSDAHYESEAMPEKDKVLLNTFGFSYNEDFDRAVASFVCYLAELSPEHQRIWQAHELSGNYRMHPDFFRTQILGEFPESVPICDAFFMEMEVINAMSEAMGRKPLFRSATRPKRFSLLLRPTEHELEQFGLLLDKCMSDNLEKGFFGDDVSFERTQERKDGRVEVSQKGTIRVLEEWAREKVRFVDPKPFNDAIATFREVRKLRQRPAHAVNNDAFEQAIFKRQRELMIRAYMAVKTIRQMLALHPSCKDVPIDDLLLEGKISSH